MTVFKIEWQTNRKGLIVWSLIIALVIIMFMSVFPMMQTEVMKEMVEAKLGGLPPDMLKVFHLDSGPSLLEPVGYFAYVFQYMFMAACVYAAMLGSRALIKEETDGTIEFLYAQPISRVGIVVEKFIAAVSMLLVFWLINSVVSLCAIWLFDNTKASLNMVIKDLSKIMLPEFFVLLFFLAIGFLISSIIRSANQSISLSLGLVFGLYLLGIIGDLQERLSFLKEISPMAQGGPANLLANEFAYGLIATLLAISLLALIVTSVIYKGKDLQI